MEHPSTAAGFQLAEPGAEAYDRLLVPAFFAPCAFRLVESCPPTVGDRVLDLAGGTGAVARAAAPLVGESGSIVVVDLNPGMIAYGSTTQPESEGQPAPEATVLWQRADAGDLPLSDGSVDVVYCQQGLQFFGDRELALTEAARVLVPGGRLGLAVWRSLRDNPAFADFVEVLPRHLAPTAVASLRAPFSGPDRSGLIALLRITGFDAIHSRIVTLEVRFPSPRTFFEAEVLGSPLAGPVTALGRTARDQLTSDVERKLARHTDDDGLLLAMQTWLVDARREVRGQRD